MRFVTGSRSFLATPHWARLLIDTAHADDRAASDAWIDVLCSCCSPMPSWRGGSCSNAHLTYNESDMRLPRLMRRRIDENGVS